MKRRVLSSVLCFSLLLCMLLCCMLQAHAAEAEAWLWPVETSRTINSNFGMRDVNGDGSYTGFHRGLDIACPIGTAVRAAKSGVVLEVCFAYGTEEYSVVGSMGSYGNYVSIRHADGTYSLYAHLQQTQLVRPGDTVSQGDVIAYSGRSGNASGPHCHFQASTDLVSGWSTAEHLINTMPTEESIAALGLTVVNPYVEARGFPAERMTYVWSVSSVGVTVNGAAVEWADASPYIDASNRTMVPLRAVGDALGLTVDWDAAAHEAVFSDGVKTIWFPIGSTLTHTSEGEAVQMDTAAVIVSDRTYAPVRYLAEFFGYTVGWDGESRTVLIS